MEIALPLTKEGRETLIGFADGDGRYLLTLAEEVFQTPIKDPLDLVMSIII